MLTALKQVLENVINQLYKKIKQRFILINNGDLK